MKCKKGLPAIGEACNTPKEESLVGLMGLNCELFGWKSRCKESIKGLRMGPRISDLPGLKTSPSRCGRPRHAPQADAMTVQPRLSRLRLRKDLPVTAVSSARSGTDAHIEDRALRPELTVGG